MLFHRLKCSSVIKDFIVVRAVFDESSFPLELRVDNRWLPFVRKYVHRRESVRINFNLYCGYILPTMATLGIIWCRFNHLCNFIGKENFKSVL